MGYFGISFGGLHAMWDSYYHPWGYVACISPSFWVNDQQVQKDLITEDVQGENYWLDMGTGEWQYIIPSVIHLKDEGLHYAQELFYLEIPNATHEVMYWASRVHNPLLAFFGTGENKIESMNIEVEFILSSNQDKYYKRINPIVTTDSGMKYSVSTESRYVVNNPEVGKVFEDGRFEFYQNKALEVTVEYGGMKKVVTIEDKEL